MKSNPTLIEHITAHEGVRLHPYTCPAGKITIGVGRNLTDSGISKDESDILLFNDIHKCILHAHKYVWFPVIHKVRQDVVIEMIFNLGHDGFRQFRATIAAIEIGDYNKAADQMLASRWARQVKGRAHRLARWMREGIKS